MKLQIPHEKENSIDDLCFSLKRDTPFKISSIEEVALNLEPEQLKNSIDMIHLLKIKSHLSQNQYYHAYQELKYALILQPQNICLQLELQSCVFLCTQHLRSLLHDLSNDPAIEAYYKVVQFESNLNVETLILYARYLIRTKQIQQALEILLPVIKIYPGQRGLKNCVELITQSIQHPILNSFLKKDQFKIKIQNKKSQRTFSETKKLLSTYREIQKLFELDQETYTEIDQKLKSVIQDWPKGFECDPSLKDFYYLKAIFESKKENHVEAIHCLLLITELDSTHIYAHNFLESCTISAFSNVEKFVQKDEFLETLIEFYEFYRQFGSPSFQLICEIAKQHHRENRTEVCKELIENMIALNPYDHDYLRAAIYVAEFTKDNEWTESIFLRIKQVLKHRPWDLKLASFVEEFVKS